MIFKCFLICNDVASKMFREIPGLASGIQNMIINRKVSTGIPWKFCDLN